MMAATCVNCGMTLPDPESKFCPYCNAAQFGFVTAAPDPNAELVECPKCHGTGFANEPTNRRRRFSIGRTCTMCFGEGIVTRTMRTKYRQAQIRIWMITFATVLVILLIISVIYGSTPH